MTYGRLDRFGARSSILLALVFLFVLTGLTDLAFTSAVDTVESQIVIGCQAVVHLVVGGSASETITNVA